MGGAGPIAAPGRAAELRERQAVAARAMRRAAARGDRRLALGLAEVVLGYDRLLAEARGAGPHASPAPRLLILELWPG
jgi:hypothetical protein